MPESTSPAGVVQPRRRRKWFLAVTALMSCFLSCVILEVGCRMLGFDPTPQTASVVIPPEKLHPESWLREAQLNSWVRPPFRETLLDTGDPQTGTIKTRRNNCGFREDSDTPVSKPEGVYRILVLGDSHTDGACLNTESFANRLEADLNSHISTPRCDVINAGQVVFSPYQEWWLYERVGTHFAPDLIVVAIYCGNDYWDLQQTSDRVHLTRAGERFVHQAGPSVSAPVSEPQSPPPTFRRTAKDFLRDHFATYHALAEIGPLRSTFGTPPQYSPFELKVQSLPPEARAAYFQSLGQAAYFAESPEKLPESNAMFKHTVGLFQASARRDRAELLFVVIPTLREVCPEVDPQGLATAIDRLQLSTQQASLDSAIRGMAVQAIQEAQSKVIDLQAPLLEAEQSQRGLRLYHKFDNHLAPDGHRIVADVLAKQIPPYLQKGEASPSEGNTPP